MDKELGLKTSVIIEFTRVPSIPFHFLQCQAISLMGAEKLQCKASWWCVSQTVTQAMCFSRDCYRKNDSGKEMKNPFY